MHIQALTPYLGAEITHVDCKDPSIHGDLLGALSRYGVIVLRDQQLTPEQQIDFARSFGEINVNRFFKAHPEHAEIATVIKTVDQTTAIGEAWHTDHSYDQIPAAFSMLYAKQVPACGGDTLFASTGVAYDHLSPTMQSFLLSLQAQHSSRHAFGVSQIEHESYQDGRLSNPQLATQDACHPVVIKHPLSGRPCIYVNPDFTTHIEGLYEKESEALLAMLYAQVLREEHTCRVRWQQNSLTIWDNRATWHKAMNDYQGQAREMHRITINGNAVAAYEA